MYVCVCAFACVYVCTYMHACIHKCIHTYIHTCSYIYINTTCYGVICIALTPSVPQRRKSWYPEGLNF